MFNKNRVKPFVGPGAEQKTEIVGFWAKAIIGNEAARGWCIDHGIGLTKATSESTNVVGGFLAPPELDAGIIRVVEAVGAFRQGADIRPTGSDGQVRPRRIGGVTANFVREGAPIPESSFLLDAVATAQKKLAILARGSSELFEDSAANLGEFLPTEIGYAIAAVEDDCGFNSDGTSTYAGMTGLATKLVGLKSAVSAASGHNTFATIDTNDITNLIAGVMASALPGSAWYVSASGYALTLCRLAAVSGGLVATMQPDGTIAANYLGFPVRFSAKLPDVPTSLSSKAMLFFGNLAMSSTIVERQHQAVIAISRERSLDADQVLVRGVRRLDILNHSIGDASTRGPIAMLVGA